MHHLMNTPFLRFIEVTVYALACILGGTILGIIYTGGIVQ